MTTRPHPTAELGVQCRARAAELGVAFTDYGEHRARGAREWSGGFYLEAPSGYVFAASGVHHMPVPWGVREFYKTRGDALRAVLVEMREGVERCEDDERSESCATCADLREEKGGIG